MPPPAFLSPCAHTSPPSRPYPPSPPRRPRSLHHISTAVAAAAVSLSLHLPPAAASPTIAPDVSISTYTPRPPYRTPRRPPLSRRDAEAAMLPRLAVAVACGAIIGTERRAASANAGIRTLSLVSLGSAIFALTSLHGLGGDPTRMAAAISTGIGFLGSGAINGDISGSQRQLVTAASIWIAAALGVAAASGLFSMALLGAIVTVWILRWQLLHRYARFFLVSRFQRVRSLWDARKKEAEHQNEAADEVA